jgi:hypothetical protein
MDASKVLRENPSCFQQPLIAHQRGEKTKKRTAANESLCMPAQSLHSKNMRLDILTYTCRFSWLRNSQKLIGIKTFFQYLIITDADWDKVGIKNFSLKKWLHHNVQETCKHREKCSMMHSAEQSTQDTHRKAPKVYTTG